MLSEDTVKDPSQNGDTNRVEFTWTQRLVDYFRSPREPFSFVTRERQTAIDLVPVNEASLLDIFNTYGPSPLAVQIVESLQSFSLMPDTGYNSENYLVAPKDDTQRGVVVRLSKGWRTQDYPEFNEFLAVVCDWVNQTADSPIAPEIVRYGDNAGFFSMSRSDGSSCNCTVTKYIPALGRFGIGSAEEIEGDFLNAAKAIAKVHNALVDFPKTEKGKSWLENQSGELSKRLGRPGYDAFQHKYSRMVECLCIELGQSLSGESIQAIENIMSQIVNDAVTIIKEVDLGKLTSLIRSDPSGPLIHNDLTPANILVEGPTRIIRILDYEKVGFGSLPYEAASALGALLPMVVFGKSLEELWSPISGTNKIADLATAFLDTYYGSLSQPNKVQYSKQLGEDFNGIEFRKMLAALIVARGLQCFAVAMTNATKGLQSAPPADTGLEHVVSWTAQLEDNIKIARALTDGPVTLTQIQ